MTNNINIDLSIVIPCLNERKNIETLILSIQENLTEINYEIIVVDDNSEDKTWEVVDKFKDCKNIFCFRRMNAKGLASAIIDGFMLSRGKYFLVIDGDLQHDEKIIYEMYSKILDNYNLVIASRYLNNSSNKGLNNFRLMLSKSAIKLSSLITDRSITDPMSGFFMIEKNLFFKVVNNLTGKGYKILVEILTELRKDNELKVLEVPFKFKKRKYGESKLSMSISIELLDYFYYRIVGNFIPINYIKFISVGATGALIHFFILYIFYIKFNLSYQASLIYAIELALISNYFLNNIWTFKKYQLFGYKSIKGLLKFNILAGLGGLISYFISTSIFNLGINWILASLIGAIIASLWNYNLNKIFTWKV